MNKTKDNMILTNCFACAKGKDGYFCTALNHMECMKDEKVCIFFRLKREDGKENGQDSKEE